MAAKVWYKNIKVGDKILASLDKDHSWIGILPAQIEGIVDYHFQGRYLTMYAYGRKDRFVIIDYTGHYTENNFKGSIVKKLPNKSEKYEDDEYILGY